MSPREIIASATDVAAEACGLGEVTGKLSQGLRADVIAVEGDPTEDWEALRRPTFVMAAGRRHELRPIPPREIDPDMAQKIHDTLTQGAGRPVAQGHSH
jgi:predicted amidohydrolase YtcJ